PPRLPTAVISDQPGNRRFDPPAPTQGDEYDGKATLLAPATIPIMDGLPRAVALRNITPLGASMQVPEQAVENAAMLSPGMATGRSTVRQIWFDQRKLLISQFMSVHQGASFWSFLMRPYGTILATASGFPIEF